MVIYRYVTCGSFDAYMWQALETKARFIAQLLSGDGVSRTAEDIGSQELSYAEVKAIASGNPAVLTLAESDAELQRLAILKKNHADEQYMARKNVRDLPDRIERRADLLVKLTADAATADANQDDFTIAGKDAGAKPAARLAAAMDNLPRKVQSCRSFSLGTYQGLRFGLILDPHWSPDVFLEGRTVRKDSLQNFQGPQAVLNALERLGNSYPAACEGYRQELAVAQGQLRDFQARLGLLFRHDAYLNQLTELRDLLKAGLSGEQDVPDAEDVAQQIKDLRAQHAGTGSVERTERRIVSAETPVTTRILRPEKS